jgi:hypothetical protein
MKKSRKLTPFLLMGTLSISLLATACSGSTEVEKKSSQNESGKASSSVVVEMAGKINTEFADLKVHIDSLAEETAKLYQEEVKSETLKSVDKSQYELAESGVFYRTDYEEGAVYVSSHVELTDEMKDEVYATEPLDATLKKIVEEDNGIDQAYYNNSFSYNRIYPGFDVLTTYPQEFVIPELNFYADANEENNPEKKSVWLEEPYVDPAGRGWMVSLIKPVYVEDELVGVPGLDITINSLTDKYIAESEKHLAIFSSEGTLIVGDKLIVEAFGMPTMKSHKYLETIKSDTFVPDEYNILKSKNKVVREAADKIIKGGEKEVSFDNNDSTYAVYAEKIPELNWILVEVE